MKAGYERTDIPGGISLDVRIGGGNGQWKWQARVRGGREERGYKGPEAASTRREVDKESIEGPPSLKRPVTGFILGYNSRGSGSGPVGYGDGCHGDNWARELLAKLSRTSHEGL